LLTASVVAKQDGATVHGTIVPPAEDAVPPIQIVVRAQSTSQPSVAVLVWQVLSSLN
jgi:hypothetical protein